MIPFSAQHLFMKTAKQLAIPIHKYRKILDPGGAPSLNWGNDGGGVWLFPLIVDPAQSRITREESLDEGLYRSGWPVCGGLSILPAHYGWHHTPGKRFQTM